MPNKWFDDKFYAAQKVMQMNTIRWQGRSDWDEAGYRAELARYGVTAEENFKACNAAEYAANIPSTAVNISPNELFDVGVYLQNYVNYANGAGHYSYGSISAGQWTVKSMLAHIFNDLHMSAWAHFENVGMELELNPSNLFDTSKYLADRVAAMNSYVNPDGTVGYEGRTDWTSKDVIAELKDSEQNPLQDYFDFGEPILDVEATKPSEPTIVDTSDGWTQWGDASEAQEPEQPTKPNPPAYLPPASTPSEPDPGPSDEIAGTIILTPEESSYTGKDGQNTLFEGAHPGDNECMVKPDYVIAGGANATNTLKISLGQDWQGFDAGEDGSNVTNIQRVQLEHTEEAAGQDLIFNAQNIEGVERIDISNSGTGAINLESVDTSVATINIEGETAANFSIVQTGAVVQPEAPTSLAINGEVKDLTYSVNVEDAGASGTDPIKFMPSVSASATGNVTVNVDGYARLIGKSAFTFAASQGDVAVNVAENATWGSYGGSALRFEAAKAKNFTLDSQGAIGAGDIYTVVNDDSIEDGSVTIKSNGKGMTLPPDASIADSGITLNANAATSLEIEATGQFKIAEGNLDNVQNLEVSLTKAKGIEDPLFAEDSFDMANVALTSASQVKIAGDGMNVLLGALGTEENDHTVQIDIANANHIQVGEIHSYAKDIDINLQSENYSEILGDIQSHRGSDGLRGDITLSVATGTGYNFDGIGSNGESGEDNDPGRIQLFAHNVDVDVSEVGGKVCSMGLVAAGTVQYEGNHNSDNITLYAVGAGDSVINLGDGDDHLRIELNRHISSGSDEPAGVKDGGTANLTVDLGTGSDWMGVRNVNEGTLIVNVENFTAYPCTPGTETSIDESQMEQRIITGGGTLLTENDTSTVADILKGAGIDVSEDFQYYLTKYGFDDTPNRVDSLATWYDPTSQTGYYVNGDDAATGITIIAVAGIASLDDMANVFGYADWADLDSGSQSAV